MYYSVPILLLQSSLSRWELCEKAELSDFFNKIHKERTGLTENKTLILRTD